MADVKLVLGDFTFESYEIPERIPFGGSQRLAVHQLPGGDRVVQALGRDNMPLAWSGLFLGENALARAHYVDWLRIQGKALPLSWADLSYTVVVERFECEFERFYKLPYSISCIVVEDRAAPMTSFPATGYDAALLGDLQTAQTLGGEIGDGPLSSLLGTMDSAIRAVSAFAQATRETINGVLAPVAAVQKRVQVLIGTVGNTVNEVTTLGGVLPNNPISQSANKLLGQVAATAQLPRLYQLQSVLGRVRTNLTLINATPNARRVTVGGGNLFDLAAREYGDATKWDAIAKANGLVDPAIAGITTLAIPPATAGGFIP